MGDTTTGNPAKSGPMDSGVCGSGNLATTITTESESAKIEVNNALFTAPQSSEMMKPKTNDDVQRAIEGLKDIPDEELQEFLDDEDFMEGLDVVDAWEGEEEKRPEKRAKSRSRDRERKRNSRCDCETNCRDRNHWRDHRSPNNREKLRRENRKKEETRRDPSKSTKDIERDKIRTQRDSESKILAEKKKAIKCLLDSDNVVPPGTEMEAIETIAEKQNVEKLAIPRSRRSRERKKSAERHRGSPNRRRSGERCRRSPHRRWSPIVMSPECRRSQIKSSPGSRRSPLRLSSPIRKSPFRISPGILTPEKHRSLLRLSPNHPRRLSWERRTSAEERRRSAERHRRRNEAHERDHRPSGRRSRSRERHRSRSADRHRRRYSRSPLDRRGSPKWRSRSGSRGRSPQRRAKKRSPFINEIRRQFRNEGNQQPPPPANIGYMVPPLIGGMPPMPPQIYPHDPERPPYMPPHHPGPQGMMMPGPPQGFMNFEPVHPQMPPSMNYDPTASQPLMQSDFSSGPVMYNQQNPGPIPPPILPLPVPSPQPVPAPGPIVEQGSMMYNQTHGVPLLPTPAGLQPMNIGNRRSNSPQGRSLKSNTPRSYEGERRSSTPYNGTQQAPREERLRTPEPPVISNSKATFGKTSLSSLLEASVSAKDSIGPPVLYPGFKPEILRHCEHALRDLPVEDPRLKMKGRFFFNPKKEDASSVSKERSSNSILLRKGKNKIYWDEEEERHSQIITVKSRMNVHQKICQTDEVQTEHRHVQATVTTVDIGVQVHPYELQQPAKEEKRPIMDRLDWNMRETFDYAPKPREADDLRWSLSNSSQKRPWGRAASPTTREPESRELSRERLSSDYTTRTLTVGTPARNREDYSSHRGLSSRDQFSRVLHPPNYRQDLDDRQDHFHEDRSDRSRGESPMVLDDSPDEIEEETQVFSRVTERLVFPKLPRGQPIPSFKGRGGGGGGGPRRGRPYSASRGLKEFLQ